MSSWDSKAVRRNTRDSIAFVPASAVADASMRSDRPAPETTSSTQVQDTGLAKKTTRRRKAAGDEDVNPSAGTAKSSKHNAGFLQGIADLASHVAEELYSVLHKHKQPRTEEHLEMLQLTTMITLEAILREWQKTLDDVQTPATKDTFMGKIEWAVQVPEGVVSGNETRVFDALRLDIADMIIETLQFRD